MRFYAPRLALRELRGGLAGFRVFLVCLALGVAGIAAVGSVTHALRTGLAAEGRALLGGDVAITYTYRFAEPAERAWMEEVGTVSEIAELRSMLGRPGEGRALVQVKGVDPAYPLYGTLRLAGGPGPACAEEPPSTAEDAAACREEVRATPTARWRRSRALTRLIRSTASFGSPTASRPRRRWRAATAATGW